MKKAAATLITILAGIGAILAVVFFIIEINGWKGFEFLVYGPAALFMAVVFVIIGTVALREVKIAIAAHQNKKANKE